MPVTKTAKRALRASKRKEARNKLTIIQMEKAVRSAHKKKSAKEVIAAISLIDRAAKKGLLHSNKAARVKSQLAKLLILKAKKSLPKKASKKKK